MRKIEIESWALRIIDRVESKQPAEDFLVELKGMWPTEPNKAARRIAGHANAARGEPILWLIGVDQVTGVSGARYEELANWWPQVQAEFDGVTPVLRDLNISWKGRTIGALLFETDRAPFVVKNSAHGKTEGGPVALEVPWREGTKTRTASRSELILTLSPLQRVPDYDLLKARLRLLPMKYDQDEQSYYHWWLELALFMYPRSEIPVVIPAHRCESSFEIPGCVERTGFYSVLFPVQGKTEFTRQVGSGGFIDGPGLLLVEARSDMLPIKKIESSVAHVLLKLQPVDASQPVVIVETLHSSPNKESDIGRWELNNYPPGERKGYAFLSK